MRRKEIIAMLVAGGQGSRLGVLTADIAKPAVPFGGKYRLIDFPMSNCINSGIDTVGVLTQYQPLQLTQHIGIGIPWDLDKRNGGVTVLAPHIKGEQGEWYTGSANAVFQNIDFISQYNPAYVLILYTDHAYEMDYSKLLEFHKKNNSEVTIAALEVPIGEAGRYGIMNTDESDKIYEFEEKPPVPKNNLANMGIYIFNWPVLREALIADNKVHADSDFGKHVLPMLLEKGHRMFAYRFNSYWKDVGTIESYWSTNMDLVQTLPEFNLYDDFMKIYTNADHQPPLYTGPNADVRTSLVSEGCEILGRVHNSVLGPEVTVDENAEVYDSIIMRNTVIGGGAKLFKCIVDESCVIGKGVVIGEGENVPNIEKPKVYEAGITVVGKLSVIPDHVSIGKNCVIYGKTEFENYPDGRLASGGSIVHEMNVEEAEA